MFFPISSEVHGILFWFSLWTFSGLLPQTGACYKCIRGCVRGFNSDLKTSFNWKFCIPKYWYLAFLKIWVTIFIERRTSISSFQFNNVLYSFGQHLLDSKLFQFLEIIPSGFLLSYFSHKFDSKKLIWGITELKLRNLQLLKIFTHKMGSSCSKFYTKKWLSSEVWDPNTWHVYPCIQIWQVSPPPWACYKQYKCSTKYPLSEKIDFRNVTHMTQVSNHLTILANTSGSFNSC